MASGAEVTTTDRGHGRLQRRTIRVLPVPEQVTFPHAAQAFLIERYRSWLDGTDQCAAAVLGITSRSIEQISPPELASVARGHWGIENEVHWVRDVTYGEDTTAALMRGMAQRTHCANTAVIARALSPLPLKAGTLTLVYVWLLESLVPMAHAMNAWSNCQDLWMAPSDVEPVAGGVGQPGACW